MAGLNPTEVDEFMDLIRRIRDDGVDDPPDRAYHARDTCHFPDEVLVLDYGEKIYEGTVKAWSRTRW